MSATEVSRPSPVAEFRHPTPPPTSTQKTPRPLPQFFDGESPTFSTKRARTTPIISKKNRPPPLPVSSTHISRIYTLDQNPLNQSAKGSLGIKRARLISFVSQTLPMTRSQSLYRKCNSPNSTFYRNYDDTRSESYFEQTFEIEEKIGEGSFGEVFKVRSKDDGAHYAVKRAVQKFKSLRDRNSKLNEVQKHEILPKHPNIVNFVRAWEEDGRLYIQTELCKYSLAELSERFYRDTQYNMPESLIWNYLADLLQALKHLHDRDLLHMDVKPENIFLSENDVCKLGDFGLMVDIKNQDPDDIVEGDSRYLAPEFMQGHMGMSSDIFSLGMTILEMATDLEVPKDGDVWHWLREGILPDDLIFRLSPELKTIIRRMMDPDPEKRPSARELLSLPQVKTVCKSRKRKWDSDKKRTLPEIQRLTFDESP